MDKRIDITVRQTGATQTHVVQQQNAVIQAQGGSAIKVTAARSEVTAMQREGDDLILHFADGTAVRLEGYFNCPPGDIADLIFIEPGNGQQWLTDLGSEACYLPTDTTTEALSYSFAPAGAAGGLSGGLLAGLGAVAAGIGVAAAAGGGGGGGGSDGGTAVDSTPPAAPTVAPTNGRSLSGSAEAGSTVRIDVNGDGSVDATATADNAGRWSYTPATPIGDGVTVRVTAVDAAGNASPSTSVTVDAAAPPAPVINPSNGTALGGTAEAGATIGLDLDGDGDVDATTTADASGNWNYTPSTPIPDGTTVTAVATDAVGNSSAPASIDIDAVPPAAPLVDPSNGTELTGTAEPGATVGIDSDGDGTIDTTVPVDDQGNWSHVPATPIADGTTVEVVATDPSGNTSSPATVVVDATAPAIPVVGTVVDDAGTTTGPVANGGSTDDTTPTLSGSGVEANAIVSVYDGGALLGTVVADTSGNWNFTPTTPLLEGTHSFTVTATDGTGNVSAASAAYVLTVDTSAPAAPLLAPTDGTTVSGSAEAGATIDLDTDGDGLSDATAVADASGDWSITLASPLANGTVISAIATDAAGNSSTPDTVTVDTGLDTTPPAIPTIGAVADDVGPILGAVANGGSTDDMTPTLSGTGAEANAIVSVYDGGTLLGTAAVDGSGNWNFTPTAPLGEGTHSLTVTATDAAGNVSAASAAYVLTVDTSAPATPVLAPTDGTTISGTAEAGATIALDTDGDGISDETTTVDASGDWSITLASPLANGTVVTAIATDAAGNSSTPDTVTVDTGLDTTPPAIPGIGGVADDVGAILGPIANGGSTDDTVPTLSGTGVEANAIVSVYDGSTLLGTTSADGSGNWSFAPTAPLGEGTHSFTVTATDAAGNVSAASAAYVLTVDTSAPAAPILAPSDGTTLSGIAEAGAIIDLDTDGDGVFDETTTADPSGDWSITLASPLANGTVVNAIATDAAGNSSLAGAVTVNTGLDTTPPAVPSIAAVADDAGSILGPVANGGITDDATPTLSGLGVEANAIISVYDGSTLLGTATADALGNWSFTPTTPLGAGSHSFTVTATDAAGNESAASAAYALTVDTVASIPTITGMTDNAGSVLGGVISGGTTDDTTPTLSGTGAEANASISIYDGNILLGTATADASGNWSFTPTTPLGEGLHSFTATATDAAGNVSLASAAYAVTIDLTVPPVPTITGASDNAGSILGGVISGGSTDDTTPTLSGTGAEANGTVSVYDGSTLLGTATADASGNWNFTPTAPLGEGPHSFTAVGVDAAGNASIASAPYALTIDLTIPAAPTITGVSDNVGSVLGAVALGGATDDTTPTISGTGAEANANVSVYDGGTLLGTATADVSGNWNFTPTTPLGNGPHSFTAVVTDAVGNTGLASAPYAIAIDTVAPTATVAITALRDDTQVVGDWATDDTSPTIIGTLSAPLAGGERVEVSLDGGATWTQAATSGTSWSYGPGTLGAGAHVVDVRVVDAVGNVGSTAAQPITITNVNDAPIVLASDSSLLGLVSAEALGLLDIGSQAFVAIDPENSLQSVVLDFTPLLTVGTQVFTVSQDLATELGLAVNVNNQFVTVLGTPVSTISSTMTITALDGGPIDNMAINELLRAVHFSSPLGLNVNLLSGISITATDTAGASRTDNAASLLDANLLNTLLGGSSDPTILEGTAGVNILTGTAANEHLYGYGGADILQGGGGNDILRGGAGADTLDGGTGNDILLFDAADTLIDGGAGADALLVRGDSSVSLNLDAATNIRNMERIDLGVGDTGHSLTLTEAGIIQATDANRQLIITGENNDSVTMTGAVHVGQALVDNHAYEQYSLGTTTVLIEDPVLVVV
ncbi:Ig-like domain-containing protein [Sphingobium sp. RSMS]|uniref:Ig-like domain-containing protein n=1 Tax=Sphingobium sp. RSMS TaxID=520734 RepID=UPI0010F5A1D3|nr:Ig-like domain-containing protein [Sphingobium sp. RSMS]UXC91398.1 Ig-like domain-containing protein [Sphingobium sp. RSMS]